MIPAQQPSQDDASIAEEEDALVLRMEAAMMLADAAAPAAADPPDEVEERLSFADSERFDDDDEEQFSAQSSESSSSFSHHWRGWARAGAASTAAALANTIRDGIVGGTGECQGLIASSAAAFFGPDLPVLASALEAATEEGKDGPSIPSLKDLASRRVASALSFELIESTYARLPRAQKRLRPGVGTGEQQDYLPEQLVLMILGHCFPESVDNIRLYSCLTNCGDRLFALGEQLYQNGAVSELFQIGYHLSAVVQERFNNGGPSGNNLNGPFRQFDVCIRVDRCRIVSCSCSCSNASFWCQHAVAACLQRIQRPNSVEYRPAIWDSITSLRDTELKKLAQYLVNELPKEYIPVAQKLIDALKNPRSEINRTQGAPDPTAGPTDDTPAVWCMDERALHGEVRKTLINFMRPSAMVCEVQSLLTSPPALAHEWSILHRTLCAKQPESMWNLLGMVRVMLSRGDANGPALLHVLTEECLALDSVLLRWYQISLTASGFWHPIAPNAGGGGGGNGNGGGQQRGNAQQSQSRQLNLHFLCQELAYLWELIALNPRLGAEERERLWLLLQLYQRTAVARIWAILGKMGSGTENQHMFATVVDGQGHRLGQQNAPFSQQFFPAFFPALQACRQIDWTSSEVQRIVQNMEMGSRLGIDIQMAERQNGIGRLPNLPFLREWTDGIFLMDLVEMEQKLGSTASFNPDTVVLPPRSSKWKKKRRKKGIGYSSSSRKSTKNGGNEKEKAKKLGETKSENTEIVKRRDSQNEIEQLSEVSTDDEQQMDKKAAAGPSEHLKKREAYEDALDALFAAAHAEIDDPFTLRFTCCEALFAHGYFREALQLAEQLAAELLDNQPNLLAARNSMASNISTGGGHSSGIGGDGDEPADRLTSDALLLDSSMYEETTAGCGGVGTGGSFSFDGGNNNGNSGGGSGGIGGGGGKSSTAGRPLLSRNFTMHGQFRRQFSADSFRRFQTIGGGATSTVGGRGWLCRSHPRLMASSLLAKQTLWRTLFLAKLLLLGEEFMARRRSKSRQNSISGGVFVSPELGQFWLRALELCLAILGNPRGPAATKLLEMELNHLEGEINTLLHRIPLCPLGLGIVRAVAQRHLANNNWKVVDGKVPNNMTVPPTKMAHYMVNALSYTHQLMRSGITCATRSTTTTTTSQSMMMQQSGGGGGMEVLPPCQADVFAHRVPADDDLALELALQVLSKDVHISETDHPILCECIRRNRKDLQMILLTRNRDCTEKLARILSTALDPKVHRMYEDHHCSNVDFFLPSSTTSMMVSSSSSALLIHPLQLQQKAVAAFYPNRPQPPPISATQSSSSSATSSPSSSPFSPPISRFGVGGQQLEFGGNSSSRRKTSGEQSASVDLINNNNCSPGPNRIMGGGLLERFPLYSAGPPTMPMLANQASEAQAHHMFEFAKSMLQEAGGNQSSAMFNPMVVEGGGGGGQAAVSIGFPGGGGGNAAGPHRNLHICSLLIALYALGLNNECSPSWNTRTYSTHVSWIQAQSLDIGQQALEIIRRTWRKHLTPTEVATLADKASQSADRATVEKAAQLALSVLPEANSLLPTESHKALNQCKERSAKMLEEACLAVEKAAEQGGVYPEVLFRVAHHWYDLYLAHVDMESGNSSSSSNAATNNANNHFHFYSIHHHPQQQQQHSPPSIGHNQHRSVAHHHHHQHHHSHHSHAWAGGNGIGTNSTSGSFSAVYSGMIGEHTFGQPPPPLNTPSAYWQMSTGTNAIAIGQHHQPSHVHFSLGQMSSAATANASATTAQPHPPPFFSPSIPPPPLPPPHPPIPPIASTTNNTSNNNNSSNSFRLQSSLSAPNMASSQQQQQQAQMPLQFQAPPPQSATILPQPAPLYLQGPPILATHQNLMASMSQMPPPPVQFGPQPLANAFVQISSPNHRIHQSFFRGDHRKPHMDERALQLLKNVHRVGIAAMTNLRSIESVHAKFAKCPPNCDEICWLLDVSLEIADPEYVRLFCEKAIACVGSPFVLLELLRGVFKFFQHFPNAHRIPGTGQLDLILQNGTASGELAKACIQQAKAAMIQHQMAGPQIELALHSIGAAFNAACHKLNFTNFNAPDQEYVCELAMVTRDLFRLIPPWHEPIKRKYMEWFMEHCGKQKCFKKFKSVQTAVQNALYQQQQQHQQPRQQIIFSTSQSSSSSSNVVQTTILGAAGNSC